VSGKLGKKGGKIICGQQSELTSKDTLLVNKEKYSKRLIILVRFLGGNFVILL